jgi:hypothetical protein
MASDVSLWYAYEGEPVKTRDPPAGNRTTPAYEKNPVELCSLRSLSLGRLQRVAVFQSLQETI